ncbi:uncharacterized protein PHACADRAFT_265096 [Phanerochaete carnosa HHB-10118-sp]|uniref:F-box domain-containing protein n=1 Tax=Phanerochaete carnosa (strain HHB-10118-sp) TaxID=650164 RepID=K5VSK8_PHACS|nr:uncharacterized protein PHACADRAFT_265096 [Phanerochaete carnosa HHB-10118-sp]EKM49554.1 hypothetical protein PHACADRAFT_265096 [Phanerochaete carnosa HHB-10118-sp]
MERCPVELWLRIVTLACTDGGYTGCSLCLVSQRMRHIVESVRFLSISLVHEEQLLAFSRLLPDPDSQYSPPVIRHLLIFVKLYFRSDPEGKSRGESLQQATRKIISVAAPNVETLVVHQARYDLVFSMLKFPALRDLSLDGLSSSSEINISRFPALRRLHLGSSQVLLDFWSDLAHFARSLTHLRISGIALSRTISPFLLILLDLPIQNHAESIAAIRRDNEYTLSSADAANAVAFAEGLPALEHIVIQPYKIGIVSRRAPGIREHYLMKYGLVRIARACAQAQGTKKLYVLPDSPAYSVDEARRDWLEMVEGGDGPWSASADGYGVGASVHNQRQEEHGAHDVRPPPHLLRRIPHQALPTEGELPPTS